MTKLQRLDISFCNSLLHLPIGIKELTSLRILPWFPIGKESGAKIEELGDLNLIEGELWMYGLETIGGLREAKSAKLNCKTNLYCLVLSWSRFREMFSYDEEVLEGLEPNTHLKELSIFHHMGKIISPSWMVSLSSLVVFRFTSCMKCEHIPSFGRLPNLRVVKLWEMSSLKCLHDDINMHEDNNDMFLCLQELSIYNSPHLVSLPSTLLKLEILELETCEGLISLPDTMPNIRKLKLLYCDGLLSLPDKIQNFKDLNQLDVYDWRRNGMDEGME